MSEEILNEVTSEEVPAVEETSDETPQAELPELSDEQRQAVIQQHKYTAKINGEEKEYTYDDMIKGAQKGESSDVRFREANEIKTKYEGLMQNLDTLAQTDEGKKKIAEVFGLQLAAEMQEPQEPVEYESPEQEMIAGLKDEIKALKGEVQGVSSQYENDKLSAEEATLRNEFNHSAEKFPVMQDRQLQEFAAQMMIKNPKMSTEDAFQSVANLISGKAETLKDNYIQEKKQIAKKQIVIGGGEIASSAKDLSEAKSVGERANMLLEMLKTKE